MSPAGQGFLAPQTHNAPLIFCPDLEKTQKKKKINDPNPELTRRYSFLTGPDQNIISSTQK